jgi:hypothetical protein
VIEIGSRKRNQPPPPHIVCQSLSDPNRDPDRPWLHLLDDEQLPAAITTEPPHTVTWSSIWTRRPDAVIRFDLSTDGSDGTSLGWTVLVNEPGPDDALVGDIRKRMNELINANLRYTYGQ